MDKSCLFVIPGNHDVDRPRGEHLLRTLADTQASHTFFNNQHSIGNFLGKQEAFRQWYNAYFVGVRQLEPNTTCEPPQIIDINGVRIAIAAINSALFCQDEHDHNKLWVGRRCLDPVADAIQNLNGEVDVRIALIHHPLEWLHDGERSNITAKLNDTFDVILRGHLHETDALQTYGVLGSAMHCASGAAYQGSQWPNRVLYASVHFETKSLVIHPIRYEDSPRTTWTLDSSVFPRSNDYTGRFSIAWKGQPPPSSLHDGGG